MRVFLVTGSMKSGWQKSMPVSTIPTMTPVPSLPVAFALVPIEYPLRESPIHVRSNGTGTVWLAAIVAEHWT